jgi:hypothetical protein
VVSDDDPTFTTTLRASTTSCLAAATRFLTLCVTAFFAIYASGLCGRPGVSPHGRPLRGG